MKDLDRSIDKLLKKLGADLNAYAYFQLIDKIHKKTKKAYTEGYNDAYKLNK